MYLHICKDIIIKKEDIIGIFKMDSIEKTKEFELIKENLNDKIIDESNGEKKFFYSYKR